MQAQEITFKDHFEEFGFATKPFPDSIRTHMLQEIYRRIDEVSKPYCNNANASLEEMAMSVPDDVWAIEMTRANRIFSTDLACMIAKWADENVRQEFGRESSCVNVVYPEEYVTNSKLTSEDKSIYWRCVRPGKPDAGRPHRDASFWDLEFGEGYDPKIPFEWNYLKDCVKIWIPLQGCVPQTTLQVIPKSHLMDVETIVQQTEYGRRPSISDNWLNKMNNQYHSPKELSEGSCIVFDMNLVHKGPSHNNSKLRISAELNLIMK